MSMKELRARLGLRSPIEKRDAAAAENATREALGALHDLHETLMHREAELTVVRDHRDALLDAVKAYEKDQQALVDENRQLRARLELALQDVEDLLQDLQAYVDDVEYYRSNEYRGW